MAKPKTPVIPEASFQHILHAIIITTVDAVKLGKAAKDALADSLDEMSTKIRAGKLNIEATVAKAKTQQGRLEGQRSKLINDG